jgi:hypothetical protein
MPGCHHSLLLGDPIRLRLNIQPVLASEVQCVTSLRGCEMTILQRYLKSAELLQLPDMSKAQISFEPETYCCDRMVLFQSLVMVVGNERMESSSSTARVSRALHQAESRHDSFLVQLLALNRARMIVHMAIERRLHMKQSKQ